MKFLKAFLFTLLFLIGIFSGCGKSTNEISLQNIPWYPAATPEQSMKGSSMGGIVGGALTQLSTTDPFDTVVEFYTNELNSYSPEIMSHTSALGRQTAITIKQKQKVITVAIQEHGEEGRVMITHMGVGK